MTDRFGDEDVQSAVGVGLTTWPEVLDVLRSELHIPEGAIQEWRAGDRDVAAVLVEWVRRETLTRTSA